MANMPDPISWNGWDTDDDQGDDFEVRRGQMNINMLAHCRSTLMSKFSGLCEIADFQK
jgi:hypothetical protein